MNDSPPIAAWPPSGVTIDWSPEALRGLLREAASAWVQVHGGYTGRDGFYSTCENEFLWAAERAYLEVAAEWEDAHQSAQKAQAARPPKPPTKGCFLYRLWDDDGRLIYVGVSRSLRARLAVHRRTWDTSVWTTATWEEQPDVATMFAAERLAIADEAPALNIKEVK